MIIDGIALTLRLAARRTRIFMTMRLCASDIHSVPMCSGTQGDTEGSQELHIEAKNFIVVLKERFVSYFYESYLIRFESYFRIFRTLEKTRGSAKDSNDPKVPMLLRLLGS